MNRVVIKLSSHGEFDGYVSDDPIELIVFNPDCRNEPFYHYQEKDNHGVHHVRKVLGDSPIGYGGADLLTDVSGSKPKLETVKDIS